MDRKRETQKHLAHFCAGIEEYYSGIQNNCYDIPISLERGLSGLKALSILNGEFFSTHFEDIYSLITKPLNEWNLDFVCEAVNGFGIKDLIMYNEFIDPEDEDEEYTDEFYGARKIKNTLSERNIDEYFSLSEPFYEIRNSCDTQKKYEIFRDGLQKTLIKNRDIRTTFKGLDDYDIENIRKKFYTELNPLTQIYDGYVYACPECGYPMEKSGNNLFYCPMLKCNDKKDKLGISKIAYDKIPANGLRVLVYDIQAFIKIPGIAEELLLRELNKLAIKESFIKSVSKYPLKDLADALVEFDDGTVDIIDVKDYRDSVNLAKYLNKNKDVTEKDGVPKYTNAYIVIPDYLNTPLYKRVFDNHIKNKKITMVSISEYIKLVKSRCSKYQKQLTLLDK